MSISKNLKVLEFEKSILDGVEIKRCRYTPHSYKAHVHMELSLGYISEGATVLSIDEHPVKFNLGDGVIIPPLMTHRCAPLDIDNWAYTMLYIDPVYFDTFVSFSKPQKLVGKQAEKLIRFMDELVEEKNPDLLEHVLVELLIEYGVTKDYDFGHDNETFNIGDIKCYLEEHLDSVISLDLLQARFQVNKFSLIRQFKKSYGTTPASYHLQCRIAEAKLRLSQGAEVLDVCSTFGFYDQAHFIKEFKRMHGITPSVYKGHLKI